MNLRILIADDHDLLRRGVKTLLEVHRGWNVCAEAATGREAVEKAVKLKPDIAILDMGMPEINGLEASKRIRKLCPDTQILILSMHYSDQMIREFICAGVRGYVVKSDPERDLVTAIEALAKREPFFTMHAARVILSNYNPGRTAAKSAGPIHERLTSREKEVVQLVATGKSSSEAAIRLGISKKTADKHRANVMLKLKLHSVTDLVRYALRNQIIDT